VIRARLSPEAKPPAVGDDAWLKVMGTHTCFYKNEELIA
jgi:glycerol transport system ATP-binding protein